MNPYFTILLRPVDNPTRWHPTEKVGPFSTLSRGAFPTLDDAHEWARDHLPGHLYTVRRFSDYEIPKDFGPFKAGSS